MTEVAGGERRVLLMELTGEQHILTFEGPNLHAVPPYQYHRAVKCLTAAYPQVSVRQFLQDLCGRA